MSQVIFNNIREAIARYRPDLLASFDSSGKDKASITDFLAVHFPLPTSLNSSWAEQLMLRAPDLIQLITES